MDMHSTEWHRTLRTSSALLRALVEFCRRPHVTIVVCCFGHQALADGGPAALYGKIQVNDCLLKCVSCMLLFRGRGMGCACFERMNACAVRGISARRPASIRGIGGALLGCRLAPNLRHHKGCAAMLPATCLARHRPLQRTRPLASCLLPLASCLLPLASRLSLLPALP